MRANATSPLASGVVVSTAVLMISRSRMAPPRFCLLRLSRVAAHLVPPFAREPVAPSHGLHTGCRPRLARALLREGHAGAHRVAHDEPEPRPRDSADPGRHRL